ncbi:hypothetical protein [Aggregatibacter actinomycetemcomitans]
MDKEDAEDMFPVSTHSHLKVAASFFSALPECLPVSTHSHLKVAVPI